MKKIITSIICLLTLTTLKAQEFNINSEKSIIEFNYIGEDAVGTINGVNGTINFNTSDLSKSYFEGRANISSINTGNKTRDAHLNASDYFGTLSDVSNKALWKYNVFLVDNDLLSSDFL